MLLNGRRILLIDDENVLRAAIADALRDEGHVVTEAGTVFDAETAFIESRHDVVITDLRLPDGSGMELLSRLRALDARFEAIVTTGFGGYQQALDAIRLKVSAFLSKPFAASDLIRTVGDLSREPAPVEAGNIYRCAATTAAVEETLQQIGPGLAAGGAQPWVVARAHELMMEGLLNVVRHAYPDSAGSIQIEISRDGESLMIAIRDAGCGFELSGALAGALDADLRVEAAGLLKFYRGADEVRIDSEPGRGTNLQFKFNRAFDAGADAPCRADDDVALACLWS